MSSALSTGEKVHIITRRRFSEDPRRHFVGTVRAVEGPLGRIEGNVFVYNQGSSEWERRTELRTRIIPLTDANLIINVLPETLDLDKLHYKTVERKLVATDGEGYTLDINEFGAMA